MISRRRELLRLLWLGGIGGLAGCTTSVDDGPGVPETTRAGETTVPEPDELPEGLREDGIDVDVLHERIVREVTEGSYHTAGTRNRYDENDEFHFGEARGARGNNDLERGLHVRASDSGRPIDDPTDGADVDVDYFDGEDGYRNSDDGPEPYDRGFDGFTQEVVDWAQIIFKIIDGTEWDSPEWDPAEGLYVVPAVEITDWPDEGDGPTVLGGELHVDPDGLPVHLSSRIDDGYGVVRYEDGTETRTAIPIANDEITFEAGDVTVEEPDWVDEVQGG